MNKGSNISNFCNVYNNCWHNALFSERYRLKLGGVNPLKTYKYSYGVLGFLPYMVALSTHVRLDENVVIDKPTYGDTDVDVEHIKSYGHLTSSSAKPKILCYFDLTLISATLCHACRHISTSELYRYDGIPLRHHVDHSISNRYWPTSLAKSNEKTPFRYRFIKGNAALDRHIQFRWENDTRSMSEIGLQHRSRGKYAIMVSFRFHYLYVGST